jgi:hypothetical protein
LNVDKIHELYLREFYLIPTKFKKKMSTKFQNKYHIKSNRWQFWDYSAPGNGVSSTVDKIHEFYLHEFYQPPSPLSIATPITTTIITTTTNRYE